jgi:sulfur carrier protein ThiS adenylyltransferase
VNDFEQKIEYYLGKDHFKKLQKATIGIAGCGGLGSNCANSLIRTGVKKLIIVDFDSVEISNLNRQFYFSDQIGKTKVQTLKENLLRINPDAEITAICRKLEENNIVATFASCNVVVEAFDNADYKSLIVSTLLSSNKFIVSASGLAGYGKSDEIKIHKIKEKLAIIGDLKSETSLKSPPLAPRVNIAAAKQADVVIEYILNK